VIHLERVLGIAWEGAVQSTVAGSRFLEDLANAIYIYGHWPVLILAGVLLYRYRREHYYTLRNVCLLTGLLGLFVFALFPVAPPRLTDLPLVDTVTKGASGYRQILPPALVNQYAALPSFHAGWNLAVGIVVFQATRHWALRAFAVLMPAAMALAVVATANHFVIDVVAGVALVLVAFALQRVSVGPRGLHVGMPGCTTAAHAPPSTAWPRPTPRSRWRPRSSHASTPSVAPRTTSPWGRSTCSTTRCCGSRSRSSTSSRGCSATGGRRPG
jgi:hypothetical protein